MKRILGLDLGTTSIGWALVNESETPEEKSEIIRLGVRVNPLTTDEQKNFEEGKSITTNAERTLARSMRRNLQRYKLRREHLINTLKAHSIISDDTHLYEQGNRTTFETLYLRAKAANEEVTLEELARILLMLNKKRGYKSNRKLKSSEEDGTMIDSIDIAEKLYGNGWTPGEYGLDLISQNRYAIPDFYKSDLLNELQKIWEYQKQYYPEIMTDDFFNDLKNKSRKQTWAICNRHFAVEGQKRTLKGRDLVRENYELRVKGLHDKLNPEEMVIVFQEINNQVQNSSGYLGNISDRSKELKINKMTIGQMLVKELGDNPNTSLKNKVYYRQDYLDEFERIWATQASYHPELTEELKAEIRDTVIFYQRRLKSQKGLVSFCELEGHEITKNIDGIEKTITVGPKVCPKSSPLFQEFRIWQNLNNARINGKELELEQKKILAEELSIKKELKPAQVFKILGIKGKDNKLNFEKIEGNRTLSSLYDAYAKIIRNSGHGEFDFEKCSKSEVINTVKEIFQGLEWNTDYLTFDYRAGEEIQTNPLFRLWHLLYSYEGDNSTSGNEKLIGKISELYHMDKGYATILANTTFEPDYGSLSTKAILRILPFLKEGYEYSEACSKAGYRHSKSSLTKEELAEKHYLDKLDSLKKNSLRNPVVEKILNQMINVVNGIIEEYGKPDEIRIELARELKKSKKEREATTSSLRETKANHDRIVKKLQEDYGFTNPSRNDIIRYKLYEELAFNDHKTLYSDTYISESELFSTNFDIEHIIPQSRFFDDSFANKTLEVRQINIEKGNMTAYDFVKQRWPEKIADYTEKIETLCKNKRISETKRKRLLTTQKDIQDGFLERELRDSQYIAKKAKEMLESVVSSVVTTTGSVTARLREDWQLVNVMQELNWDKYTKLGKTSTITRHGGHQVRQIEGWTKRNDHRHHAMDALTIAFTKRSYIQYLNNLNARMNSTEEKDAEIDLSAYQYANLPVEDRSSVVKFIEKKQMRRDSKNRLRFLPPMPLDEFRDEAKKHLDSVIISIKAKNKVVTRNNNITKTKGSGKNNKIQLTPRGQMHLETIYGKSEHYATYDIKVDGKLDMNKIMTIAKKTYRDALLHRLEEFGNDPKKAFAGKNSLDKNPLYVDAGHTAVVPKIVKAVRMEEYYTVRKPVNKDLKVEKVADLEIRRILQQRLDEFGGNPEKAFSNLEQNPIWFNKEKGLCIKKVAINENVNPEPIHDKRDIAGIKIRNEAGNYIPTDYVKPGNNHHVAIFRDETGNIQEQIVTFIEAVGRVNAGDPVIFKDYNKDKGWTFLFSMKPNEMFVFPNEETGFDPYDIDLTDEANYPLISPNMFRVQKLSSKYYNFRHHLDTTTEEDKELRDITWKRIQNLKLLEHVRKVRVNHLGKIVQVGEY